MDLCHVVRRLASRTAFASLALACDQHPTPRAAPSADVPAYLQPAFHSLDSLLTGQQRDSLRALPLDSAFVYRNHRLADVIKPVGDSWSHSPIGDTVLAHGEKSYMTSSIVLDLYQQHLRHESLDIIGALRRISPTYADSILPHTVAVDSVLLQQDLDDSNITDQLVREARRRPIEVDVENSNSGEVDTVSYAGYRLALYLDVAPLTSRPPAWSADFEWKDDASLIRTIPLPAGGSLLVLDLVSADASETAIVLVRHGEAREILRHQIDYGEGNFALRDADGRIAVDVTGDVQLGLRHVTPEIKCADKKWPGATLVYDESTRGFVLERAICILRQ